MNDKDSQTIPATVRTVVSNSTIQIVLLPGVGLADGGIPVDVPIEIVPVELRLPNAMLTVTMHASNVIAVRARDSGK